MITELTASKIFYAPEGTTSLKITNKKGWYLLYECRGGKMEKPIKMEGDTSFTGNLSGYKITCAADSEQTVEYEAVQ